MKRNCMLVSVGGSPAPIIKSIEHHSPEKVIFFVSHDSYGKVTSEILPPLMNSLGRLLPHENVLTPDYQDVGESTFVLLRDVPVAMHKLGLDADWPELVDFTAGTKPMSAALVWASSRYKCEFSYVGSDEPEARNKGGLGVVIDDKERILLLENPWNETAYFDVRQGVTLFNGGQYANAVKSLEAVLDRVSDSRRQRVLGLLLEVWRGFEAWDRFDHTGAVRHLDHAKELVDSVALEEPLWPGITAFAEKSCECAGDLKDIITRKPGQLSWSKIADLMSNALRRARLEGRYDDATARCYAAIEKYGKHSLQLRHGINNSNCRPEQLPDTLREEYQARYSDEHGRLRFGLQATYRLLAELGDEVGIRFSDVEADLNRLLPLRNESILGHGTIPIKENNFEELFAVGLRLMNWQESDLTVFPVLR